MENISRMFPGNFKEKEKLDSSVPQSTREKHNQVIACNQIHIYNLCVCSCVHTYVNGTDMNDYPLQQIWYQLLDLIYPKSRSVDRPGNNSVSAFFPTPTLPKLVVFSFPDVCLSTVCVAGDFLTFSSFLTDDERDQSALVYSDQD